MEELCFGIKRIYSVDEEVRFWTKDLFKSLFASKEWQSFNCTIWVDVAKSLLKYFRFWSTQC